MLPFVWQFLARPRWLAGFLADGGLMSFPNVVLPDGPMPYADVGAALEQSARRWDDLRLDSRRLGRPDRGQGCAHRRRRAAGRGRRAPSAIVVSNHGGRQLDGVRADAARAAGGASAAVGGRVEVLLDGGIRRGSDIVKALCLGARAVLVGRAYAYGLGAGGEAGVAKAIEILRGDVVRTLKLLGCASVAELDASYVDVPPHWR